MLYCPVCRCHDIYPVAGGYIGQVYLCKACGYRGSFVLETDDTGGEEEGGNTRAPETGASRE